MFDPAAITALYELTLPYCVFHVSWIPTLSVLVLRIASTSLGDSWGLADQMSAMRPATRGQLNDVPDTRA